MKKYLKTDEWNIIEDQFHPDRQRMSESIFSLGNGRFGQRGYFEEPYSSDSYRGSFVAGITFLDKTRVGWWKNGFPPYYTRIPKVADWSRINLRLIDEEAPKWGNDDPEADAMVIDLTSFIIKKIAAFRGLLGNQKPPGYEGRYLLPGHGGDVSSRKPAPHPCRAYHKYGKTQPLSHQVQCVFHQLYRQNLTRAHP